MHLHHKVLTLFLVARLSIWLKNLIVLSVKIHKLVQVLCVLAKLLD